MADYTTNYSFPFPEGEDDVAVHSDISGLARAVDQRIHSQFVSHGQRVTAVESSVSSLDQDVVDLENTMLPRSEAEEYGIPGEKGDPGPQGKQGIPGVEAVPADEAVAAYLGGDDTHTRTMADSMYPSRSEFIPVKDLAEAATLRNADETVEGSWTFSKGHTNLSNTAKVGVHRTFDRSKGDLFTSEVWLEMRVSSQASTNQNPPGYNIASLVMVEDGEHSEQYQGESAKIDFVSNRFRMNRRLEIMMGNGTGRATLSSGSHPGNQYARLSLHNASYPRLDLYGPDNESHNSSRKNLMVLDGARLDIHSNGTSAQRWEGESLDGLSQRLEVSQLGQGHQVIRGFYDGQNVGQIQWYPEDMSLRLIAGNRIILMNSVQARSNIEFSSSAFGPVLRSPGNKLFRIKVSDNGSITTEEVL